MTIEEIKLIIEEYDAQRRERRVSSDPYNDEHSTQKMINAMEKLEKALSDKKSGREIKALESIVAKFADVCEKQKNLNEALAKDFHDFAGRDINKVELDAIKSYQNKYLEEFSKIVDLHGQKMAMIRQGNMEGADHLAIEINALKQGLRDGLAEIKKDLPQAGAFAEDWKRSAEAKNQLKKDQAEIVQGLKEALKYEQDITKENKAQAEAEEVALNRRKQGLQVLRWIWGEVKDGAEYWKKYNEQAISDSKMLGMTSKESARAYTQSLMNNAVELMRTFGMTREQVQKMQESFAQATSRASILSQEQLKDIAATSKLMGEQNVNNAMSMMSNIGISSDKTTELLAKNYARAVNTGLNTVKASEEFVKNMNLANSLTFQNGVDGISKMTILSQRMRMNLQEVAHVADKFSTIEGAITGTAQLQMLGGQVAQLGGNPMAMMYEAMADPEALFERMVKMAGNQALFNTKTGEATISPFEMQRMKEQAKALGMNPEEFIKSAKQQASLRNLESTNKGLFDSLKGSEHGEELRALIGNKSQYNTRTGKWEITYATANGDSVTKSVSDLSQFDLQNLQKDSIDAQEDIKLNVRKIAGILVSARDREQSIKDLYGTDKARLMNGGMEVYDDVLTGVNQNDWWSNPLLGGLGTAVGLGLFGVGKWFLSNKYNTGKWLPKGLQATKAVGSGGKVASTTLKATEAVSTGGRALAVGEEAVAGSEALSASSGLVKFGSRLSKFGKIGGTATGILSVIGEVGEAYGDYKNAGDEYNVAKGRLQVRQSYANSSNNRYFRRNVDSGAEGVAQYAKDREQNGAYGQGIGATIGAVAGGALGAIFGPAGIGAGVALGAWLGGMAGKALGKDSTSSKSSSIIGKELEKINDSDEEENLRRIILPVESLDYNVSLIANALGIQSAQPAEGNIYLDAEAAGENNGGIISPIFKTPLVQVPNGENITGTPVTQGGTAVYNSIPSDISLTVQGSISLTNNGKDTIGKLTSADLKKLLDDASVKQHIVNMVKNVINQRSNGGQTQINAEQTLYK